MIVRIYKKCKLNNKYKDIFYNKTYLEGYLSLLESKEVLSDTCIFSRNNDSLFIDDISIPDFKEYNYIKISDSVGTFFAFINNIQWINGVYIINYEEDILSNYFENVHIRNSLLTANKSLKLYKGNEQKNITYYKLPIDVESNDYVSLDIDPMFTEPNDVCLIGKIQLYKLTSQDEPNSRIPLLVIFARKYTPQSGGIAYNYEFYKTHLIDNFINALINKMSDTQITFDNEQYYYEIDKIYAVPLNYISSNKINDFYTIDLFNYDNVDYVMQNLVNADNFGFWKATTKIINYDRKIDSIGLYSYPVKIFLNGTNIKTLIQVFIKGYYIAIIMNIQNKFVDVTDKFIVDMPFSQVTSSELQLQRLQLMLKNNELSNKIENANIEVEKNSILNYQDFGLGILGGGLKSLLGFFGGANSITNSLRNITEREYESIKKETDIRYMSYEQNNINRKMFSSTKIINNEFTYINAIYGIISFIKNEDNTSQIEQAIKLNGYIIREIVNDVIKELDTEHLTEHYEVFKFDEVNLYGIIAQDYLRVIERVLLNGVRVWCQNDIGELI